MGRVKFTVMDEVRVTVSGGSRPEPGGGRAAPSFLPGLPLFRDPFPNQLSLTAPTKR